jgi:hypothetical protein
MEGGTKWRAAGVFDGEAEREVERLVEAGVRELEG